MRRLFAVLGLVTGAMLVFGGPARATPAASHPATPPVDREGARRFYERLIRQTRIDLATAENADNFDETKVARIREQLERFRDQYRRLQEG